MTGATFGGGDAYYHLVPDDAEALLGKAQEALEAGEWPTAREAFEEVLE